MLLAANLLAAPSTVLAAKGGTISNSATQTTINQTTQRAAIDWQSFNVGSAQTVRFIEPNAQGTTLNRVVGSDPSQIAGRIVSNGTVIIVNQSGLTFLNGSQVDVNGLIVSTANVSNGNFMAGKLVFDQAGKPTAVVSNAGTITVGQAGLAAFLGPRVANSGTISAKLGTVVLAGGTAFVLDMYGDGLVSVNVTGRVVQAPDGSTALVTNDGVIKANGGQVILTAAAAEVVAVVQTHSKF